MNEKSFRCPYCGERISMVLDPDEGDSNYIEDCEVCCRPIRISFHGKDGAITGFQAQRSDEA